MNYNCIKTPKRYTTPSLQEGEFSVIHLLPKSPMISLSFEEQTKGDLVYKAFYDITVDKNYLLRNFEIKKELDLIEGRVISLNEIYVYYHYLFVIREGKLHLLSISLEGKPFGFQIVNEIGEKLKVEVIKPCWRGVYTKQILTAFVEDIFVQRE